MKKNRIQLFRHQILITSIAVFALVVSIFGSSYAIFTSSISSGEYNYLQVGKIELSYVDNGNGYGDVLSLNGAYPMSDQEGKQTTPYRFYVKNVGDMPVDFKLKLKNDEAIIEKDGCENELLDLNYIRVQFDSTGEVYTLADLATSDYTLYEKNNLAVGLEDIHDVRVWIAANAPNDILGKHFHGKIVIEMVQAGVDQRYTESYDIGDSVILTDGSKWHVLENASENDTTVTLISDYNLNGNGSYCLSGNCQTFAFDALTLDENNNQVSSRTVANNPYCSDETHGCNAYEKNGSTVITDSTLKNWLETTYKPLIENSLTNSGGSTEDMLVTIPTMEQIAKADNKNFDQNVVNISNNSFLTTTSYWTKTAYYGNQSSVWFINGTGNKNDLKYASDETSIGIRPVITVSKLSIASHE